MPSSISSNEGDQGRKEGNEGGAIDEIAEENGQVVTTQPRATSELRDWNSGLFHCHKDIGNCFFVACCPICAAGYELYKHDENPVLGCCFGEVLMAFVSQYRARNKIEGSLCTDFLASTFCGPCALCRLHRDYQELGH
nr:cornifelin [Hymenolepis microstoma]CDS34920.1 cornifelin [Hymenolepis microstoma]